MALQTNATDIHMSYTDLGTLVPATSPMSLGAWLNSADWNNSGAPKSMICFVLSGTTGMQIGTRGTNAIDVWVWGGTVKVSTSGLYVPVVNTWIHVMYTYDGTTHSIYVNGLLIATSISSVVSGGLNQIYINGYPTGGTAEVSNTKIDDLVVYGKCLSASEVSVLSNQSVVSSGIYDSLIANYTLNDKPSGSNVGGVALVDTSDNMYDLSTITGAGGTDMAFSPAASKLYGTFVPLT